MITSTVVLHPVEDPLNFNQFIECRYFLNPQLTVWAVVTERIDVDYILDEWSAPPINGLDCLFRLI